MRINLTVPNAPHCNAPEYEAFSIENLEKIPDATCTGIYMGCLDFVQERENLIKLATSKLRYGANIIVEGVDILDLARNLHTGNIDVVTANKLLYSNGASISCDTISNVYIYLTNAGLRIKRSRVCGNRFMIEAERPNVGSN